MSLSSDSEDLNFDDEYGTMGTDIQEVPSDIVADENAQDGSYRMEQSSYPMESYENPQDDDTEAGEHFDPTAFFQSFAPDQNYQANEDSNQDMTPRANIDYDLQVH